MISSKSRKLLKRIEKGKVVRETLENEDLEILYRNKYIEMTIYPKSDDPFVHPYITDEGKAYLESHRRDCIRTWISIALSAICTVAAIIALL